jgi:DNA-binding CsgD family transcriptional regulator
MARADAAAVLSEARWASVLADWEPLRTAADGLVALAFGVLGMPVEAPGEKIHRLDDELGVHGLRGMGQSYCVLADAYRAVWALDRPELERTLALVSIDDAAIVGAWSLRVTAQAFLDGLWGDPAKGLDRLAADILRASVLGREQEEPLGGFVIARSRLLLMTRAGAFGAAREVLGSLSEPMALLPHARLLLWSGQLQRAIAVAESGDYDDRVDVSQRQELLLIKAGAALLLGACDRPLRTAAVRAVDEAVASEDFFALASLPRPAREALIELCDPESRAAPAFRLLERRLADLNDASDRGVRPVRLTSREKLLLPLLATDVSVPEIARSLHVSVNTVRKQVVTLREKFDADTRAELVRRARNFGALT